MFGGEKAEDCQRSIRGVGGAWRKIERDEQARDPEHVTWPPKGAALAPRRCLALDFKWALDSAPRLFWRFKNQHVQCFTLKITDNGQLELCFDPEWPPSPTLQSD